MEKLDLKDRKILYHLVQDSRQSYRSLGKKIGLSKDIVTSRVKNLQEKGIIKNFITNFDHSVKYKGAHFRCYFSYQNITPQIKNEIIEFLSDSNLTVTVKSLEGNFDLLFFIISESITEVYKFWEKLLNKYRNYFSKKEFHFIYHESEYDILFLLEQQKYEKNIRKPFSQLSYNDKRETINEFDYKIIKLLSQNSRVSSIDIANKINSTATTVRNRIKYLKNTNVIRSYTIDID